MCWQQWPKYGVKHSFAFKLDDVAKEIASFGLARQEFRETSWLMFVNYGKEVFVLCQF